MQKRYDVATNLVIDDCLIRQAQLLGRQKTKKAVVTEALEEYIQRRRRQDIIKLFNKIEYEKDYDYKKQRKVK